MKGKMDHTEPIGNEIIFLKTPKPNTIKIRTAFGTKESSVRADTLLYTRFHGAFRVKKALKT
jgi:hypothetical protein